MAGIHGNSLKKSGIISVIFLALTIPGHSLVQAADLSPTASQVQQSVDKQFANTAKIHRIQAEQEKASPPPSSNPQQAGTAAANTGITSAAPPSSGQPRNPKLAALRSKIAANQRQIADLDTRIQKAQNEGGGGNLDELSRIQQEMQQQQSRIATLNAQIQSQQAETARLQQNQESYANQEAAISQQQISQLQNQINQQQAIVEARRNQLHAVTAPEDSDVINHYTAQLNQAEERLATLQSEYAAQIANQRAITQDRYSTEANRIQQQQAGQVSMQMQKAQAEGELQRLQTEYRQAQQSSSGANKNLQQLEDQRQSLVQENQRLQQQYNQLAGVSS